MLAIYVSLCGNGVSFYFYVVTYTITRRGSGYENEYLQYFTVGAKAKITM